MMEKSIWVTGIIGLEEFIREMVRTANATQTGETPVLLELKESMPLRKQCHRDEYHHCYASGCGKIKMNHLFRHMDGLENEAGQ